MSELIVFVALIPLAFIALKLPSKVQKALCWLAAVIGVLGLGYFLWIQKGGPLQWGVVFALLTLLVADVIQEKKIAPFTLLSMTLVSLASITSELGVIIIFLAFADFFLEVEIFSKGKIQEKNRAIKNVYRSLLSLLPVSFAVILQAQGQALAVAAATTIAFRIFSWPIRHWVSDTPSRLYYLIIGAASTFALWHAVDFSSQLEWSLIWLIAAGVLSLGAKEVEIYIALVLGVFSLSPQLGLLGIALWPLSLNRSAVTYVLYLFIGLSGALIADASSKVIVENASYAISVIVALLLTRSLVGVKIKSRSWYRELVDFFLAAIVIGVFVYLTPTPLLTVGVGGFVFFGVFILSFILGKFLLSRKPQFFKSVAHFKQGQSPFFFKSVEFFRERSGPAPQIQQRVYLVRFFDALDSESHLVWLLGLLGLAIWWGGK